MIQIKIKQYNHLLIFILLSTITDTNAQQCQVKNTCECVYQDGYGYDLRNLIVDSQNYLTAVVNRIQIYFSPCRNTTALPDAAKNATENNCKHGYTLCLWDELADRTYLLGSEKDTSLSTSANGAIFMKFGNTNVSIVQLECTPNAKGSTFFAPQETNSNNVNLTLFSKSSCLAHIEIKTHGFVFTFFLIFFIILFSYLVLGILYNYFFVGARGFELLPNYDFWSRLWLSIKLGFLYVKNGFRVIPSEDSYDAI